MAVMDEFKKERAALKNGTPKEKFEYFLDYYKWHAIIGLSAIVLVIFLIYSALNAKETVLSGFLLNNYNLEVEEPIDDLVNDFIQEQQIDTSKYEIYINPDLSYSAAVDDVSTAYQTGQALLTQCASGDVDFITGDLESMLLLVTSGLFADLSEILTEEQLALYEPYLLYIDMAALDELSAALAGVSEGGLPDFTDPDTMSEPVPVFINIDECQKLSDIYVYPAEPLVFGITANTPHLEMTLSFLDYLTTEND